MRRPALGVEELRAGYGGSYVLHGVTFAIHSAEIFTILGKNGMGKTTALRTIMGFLPARSGRVELFGSDVTGWLPYRITRHGVSYVPQEKSIFQDLSVEENLRLALSKPSELHERLDTAAQWFPFLKERLRQRAGTLSGGEQKMLLIARALMAKPRLVLVDEISEGLQPAVIAKVQEILVEERRRSDLTIVLVEQNVNFALALADRYAVLKLGAIVESGSAGDAGAREDVERHLIM
ncbi:MAG: ABC transporter ATP-binding protein [Nitrospiraceae bacterium]